MATWSFDPVHSAITFAVRHMVIAKVRGKFGSWKGTIDWHDPDPAASSVKVTIDAASIDTGVGDRDAHLRSADFLDAEGHPQIEFASQRIERVDAERLNMHGNLTIRGVTRPMSLEVEIGGRGKDPWGNERVGFTARGSLDRKDYGLKWNQALETGGVLVGDRVDIDLDVQIVKAAAQNAA